MSTARSWIMPPRCRVRLRTPAARPDQATAKVRLSLLSETLSPAPRTTTAAPLPPAAGRPPSRPAGGASLAPAATKCASAPRRKDAVRRVALVIGNGAYARVRPLPNPTNDAREMAKSLRAIGFVVTEGTDLDRTAMQTTIRDFLRDAAQSQVAVVYYAGHGVQVDGRNYLVPVDIQFQSGSGMTDAMMDLDRLLLRARRQCPHQHRHPRCLPRQSDGADRRSPTSRARSHRSRRRDWPRRRQLGEGATFGAGTLIAFATAPGQIAFDGAGATARSRAALPATSAHPGSKCSRC